MIKSCCVHSYPAWVRFCWIQFHDKERKKPSDNFPHLCQRLDTCVNVATGNLRDDKVDRGGCAVVQVIKVRRDRAHPWSTEEIKAKLKIEIWHLTFFNPISSIDQRVRLTWALGSWWAPAAHPACAGQGLAAHTLCSGPSRSCPGPVGTLWGWMGGWAHWAVRSDVLG